MTATARARAGSGERLAAVLSAVCAQFEVGDNPSATLPALLAEPMALYDRHPYWPSRFTAGGCPAELSVKVDARANVAFRCVADVADHRRPHVENWDAYRAATVTVAGPEPAARAALLERCRILLRGVPARWVTPIVHGLAYGAGRRRGTLYFRTGWLERDELARRLPAPMAALGEQARRYASPTSGRIEVVAYDVDAKARLDWKTYSWLPPELPIGRHPDLAPARALLDAFAPDPARAAHSHDAMLQVRGDDGAAGQRLFLFSHGWRWNEPERLEALARWVRRALGIRPDALTALTGAAREHDVPLTVQLVAVGLEGGVPSVTWYLHVDPFRGAPRRGIADELRRLPLAPTAGGGRADAVASGLLTALERAETRIGEVVPAFFELVETQRADGGWESDLELMTIARVVGALRAYAASPFALVGAVGSQAASAA